MPAYWSSFSPTNFSSKFHDGADLAGASDLGAAPSGPGFLAERSSMRPDASLAVLTGGVEVNTDAKDENGKLRLVGSAGFGACGAGLPTALRESTSARSARSSPRRARRVSLTSKSSGSASAI